ncbi:MAG: hypothetical protein ABR980_01695 [Ignavibacteriaceae bacterium]|jgi:hypothetical protein
MPVTFGGKEPRLFIEQSGVYLKALFNDISRIEIVCLFKIDDLDKAKAFTNSPNSQKSAELSGIIGIPEILFLDKA